MEQKKQADSPMVDTVKAFLAGQAAAVAREQRSPWITPWELAARLPVAAGEEEIHPTSVEAALRSLSIPCAKVGGTRRFLLAPVLPAGACLTPGCFRPTEIAAGLRLSLSVAER